MSGTVSRLPPTAPSTEFYFDQFPAEIFREIISHVRSSSVLSNLCLVSNLFNDMARPRLYESAFLSNEEQITCFSITLSNNAGLGRKVRDLCVFLSSKDFDNRPMLPVDEDSDDIEWTPGAVDSNDSSSDVTPSDDSELDRESEARNLETDDTNLDDDGQSSMASETSDISDHFHRITRRNPSLWPVERHSSRPSGADLLKEVFYPYLKPESVLYGHVCAILQRCPSLRSLYALPFEPHARFTTYLHALLPCTPLTELAVYLPMELGVCDNHPYKVPGPIVKDLSSVRRLTLFRMVIVFPSKLSTIFPNLTHLRLPGILGGMVAHLAGLKGLTHLWVTAPRYYATPARIPTQAKEMEVFLRDLRKHCPGIRRVRVDFANKGGTLQDPNAVEFMNLETKFPFVRVSVTAEPENRSMWERKTHQYVPFSVQPSQAPYFRNTYAESIENYWIEGGGWDD